ncbi:MAG: bifunctional UDP-N-acetylglucosamine diphosphorylase/glucosamine-1-phosphate N-acetyltransferase GlmU [Pseudomonadales bacterium]|nr:bifunctional UDP-N-acetylglucosamine diphosphorylase/glucosamine-1-phosphate N-acetyltransferase GlmU [Pseudomonadales bacterium]MCP5216375.1 bifunctional UDP-N-acetylglucosamine diphosphorylase/glucosamine-1-phosphate N-acetyltransferase GlmU [Pseudomonadales bacterium]
MNLEVVILAAGQGTRMKSKLPKVLHHLAGKSLLSHVICNAQELGAAAIHVVVGHGAELVKDSTATNNLNWVIQEQQLGTGHAVAQAMTSIGEDSTVLVLYGDVPLTSAQTLTDLLQKVDARSMALLTVKLADPSGYGRIIRDAAGQVKAIIEEKDATAEQRRINEGNTGILAVSSRKLKKWLPRLSTNNAQAEYYLTDTIAMAVAEDMQINAVTAQTEQEVQGINSRQQLADLERWYQKQLANQLMAQGVTLADPARLDIRGEVSVGPDIFIDANVLLEGSVSIGEGSRIGPNVVIKNAVIGAGVNIFANSVIENAEIGSGCQIGPFARLRPGTRLAQGAKIGNFVETKNAFIGVGSKVSHLSYVGDAELGKEVNIGAGTITCNYDGANKFKTEIGNGVFVGSNTALVAPIKIGENATIGAGSTLSRDVEPNTLVVARAITRVIEGWRRPTKKK